MKRALDVALAGAGLVVLAPLLAVVAAAVRLSSPGPVVFRQRRVGQGFREFELFKFRTMAVGSGGAEVTAAGDPRVTRVGRVLRRWKLDELPQLVNVVRGDMSLVGPRPEVPRYVELFRSDFADLLAVRPGITGLATLRFREEERVLAAAADPEAAYVAEVLPRKIELEREYLDRASLRYDLSLLLRTVLPARWSGRG